MGTEKARLIERDAHLKSLGDALRRAMEGSGRVVVVSGEAGIGKTALLRAFAYDQHRGSSTYWGKKLVRLKSEMDKLSAYEKQMLASPDQQISLTDPDSRSMATSGRGSCVVGYNVQLAVETKNHLIVTQPWTRQGC
jgi:hypothetical protein